MVFMASTQLRYRNTIVARPSSALYYNMVRCSLVVPITIVYVMNNISIHCMFVPHKDGSLLYIGYSLPLHSEQYYVLAWKHSLEQTRDVTQNMKRGGGPIEAAWAYMNPNCN